MNRISVLLVDDHALVREGCRQVLGREDDLCVVGEARDGRQAVEMVKTLHPDVVLMDIAMPHLNGLEATRQVAKVVPTTKVLMLSGHGESSYVRAAIKSGAVGYLTKETSAHNLCRAIREVQQGRRFFSPCLPEHHDPVNPAPAGHAGMSKKSADELTPRETEVLQLVAEGNANKQTAAKLGIGIKTVEKHRGHLMEKLQIHNTAGLTCYAVGIGIIKVSEAVS
jgi:DNA-binding NarL/FixJ family response regulator